MLMCQVLDGEPPIQIKWFKDNADLSAELTSGGPGPESQAQALSRPGAGPADQIELVSSDELGASLLFRRVRQQHSGNYTCLATNHFGSTSYSSFMSVKGGSQLSSLSISPLRPVTSSGRLMGGSLSLAAIIGRSAPSGRPQTCLDLELKRDPGRSLGSVLKWPDQGADSLKTSVGFETLNGNFEALSLSLTLRPLDLDRISGDALERRRNKWAARWLWPSEAELKLEWAGRQARRRGQN